MPETDPNPKRILLIRPSALGDVCRTVPVVVSLARAYPEATIDWVVQDTFVDVARAHPAIDRIIPFSRSRYGEIWRSARALRAFRDWISTLRERRYDVAYDLQGLGRSGLIAYLSQAKRRVGFARSREFGWLGYTVRHKPPTSRHVVDQMLELLDREGLEPIRDMRLYVPEDAQAWWTEHRASLGLEGRYAVLAPTSRHESKRWPQDRWIELLPYLRDRGLSHVVVISAPHERDQITHILELIEQDDHLVDLAGQTTVAQTMAIIEHAAIVVANDSAPLHMAVGFSRPLVGLFGPTDPAFVGPYRCESSVVQQVDFEHEGPFNYRDTSLGNVLMQRIETAHVVERIDAALDASTDESTEASTRSVSPSPEASHPEQRV